MGSLSNLSSYLQSALSTALQGAGLTTKLTTKAAANGASGVSASSLIPQPDSGQLSPLAQLMSTLQQLQQSDPAKYAQVTGQIATNLQSAAQTAQANGNTGAANQLNQLSADFTNASKSGQLPNIQDLAKAVGHHHRHGHHSHAASADSDSTAASAASDPAAIILNTLKAS